MTDNREPNRKDNKKTPLETAYAYLANRMHTVFETEQHLKGKGFRDEEVRETIAELTDLKYLDDYEYSLRYYEYNRQKRRASARAARELAEKGIDAETIGNAREDFLYANGVDEFEDALESALKDLADKRDAAFDEKAAAATARRLSNKGYESGIIFRVLERLRALCGTESEE